MISIIVPVYKSEATLERCIKSLVTQTYTDLEIIMIVDGPPDASGVIADKLSQTDKRIRVIHQKNQGVSAARSAGIDHANGQYIQFVDSDDYLESHACEYLLQALGEQDADMVIAGFYHLYFGRTIEKLPSMGGGFDMKDAKDTILALYEQQMLNMPWNKLFKRELMTEYFNDSISLGEDLIFNIHYMKHVRRLAVLQKPICYYIQDDRGTTLSTKQRDDRIPMAFLLYEEMKDFLRQYDENGSSNGILESKVIVEFLDEIENVAFVTGMSYSEKLNVIKMYANAQKRLDTSNIHLHLLDYKLIYFFFRRDCMCMTYVLIAMRGWIVKLLKRR